ncbi:hypothetical protein D3C81_2149230 [compost metagenome]
MGQTIENAAHVVHLCLNLRPAPQAGQLLLPDLADLELLAKHQHRQFCSLSDRDLLEVLQRMGIRDHQLQFIFVQ